MSDTFYNPFHFIPFNNNPNENNDLDYNEISAGNTQATHQGWQNTRLSGAIYVALTNKNALIVGDRIKDADENTPEGTLSFYRAMAPGKTDAPQLSIPGNSLRGMVSNTAEIISDSAARVLGDELYSSRKPMNKAVQAIGIIRKYIIKDQERFFIEPVALPPLLADRNNDVSIGKCNIFKTPSILNSLNWQDYVKWNVEVYSRSTDKLKEKENHPLKKANISLSRFQAQKNKNFVFVKTDPSYNHDLNESIQLQDTAVKARFDTGRNGGLLVSQKLSHHTDAILSESNYNKLGKPNGYQRAFLLCTGIKGREDKVASTKKNEYLIPYSEEKEKLSKNLSHLIELDEKQIKNYEQLCRLAHECGDWLVPQGWDSVEIKKDTPWKVLSGDIVYFSTERKNGTIEIKDLSFSQIWRKEVNGESTHGIMKKAGHERYLPWGRRENQHRKLSPAEILFGVVEELEGKAGNNDHDGRALASRVRFYDAVKINPSLATNDKPQPLTLSSPKPPSPALYLSSPQGAKLGKTEITDGHTSISLNGRKRYLQHCNEQTKQSSGTENMDTLAESLPASQIPAFGFHIEFDNLTAEELSLLLASLGAKQNEGIPHFNQQIGMGKPYGYGKVELDILGVFLKQPQQRYSTLESCAVYQQVLAGYQPNPEQLTLLQTIQSMQLNPALGQLVSHYIEHASFEPVAFIQHQNNPLISPVALTQVAMLADENNFTNADISYPSSQGSGNNSETKIFEWFVNNEETLTAEINHKKEPCQPYQFLRPLSGNTYLTPLVKTRKPNPINRKW